MNELSDDQIVAFNRKRVRRNALKPNSVECDALKEFSLLNTLSNKMDLDEQQSDKRVRLEEALDESKREIEEASCGFEHSPASVDIVSVPESVDEAESKPPAKSNQ